MNKVENQFQDRLEQLQSGQPLEACSAGLPEQEAELLALAAGLRALDTPEPDEAAAAAQRIKLLQLAKKEHTVNTPSSGGTEKERPSGAWPRWLVPVTAISGAMALLFVCVVLAVAGGVGIYRLRSRGVETVPAIADAGTPSIQVSNTATATATEPPTRKPPPTRNPQLTRARITATAETPPTQTPAPTSTPEPPPPQVSPVAAPLQAPDAQGAALQGMRGLVQVQEDDGLWTNVPAEGRIVHAGDRVRTGDLSSVTLTFYDGSAAYLGPNAELSVDELDAQPSGGPRVVVLTQSSGKSEHDVVSSSVEGARYEVNTPAGTGSAKGTLFQVNVTTTQIAYFSVDEGVIQVSHLGSVVVVVGGQVTVVRTDQPPSEPVFRVSGEGEVQEIGPKWLIAGQVFETHDATVIVGNPQVGDWVRVEGRLTSGGTRVADVIVLLRRSPANLFAIQGPVDAIGETEWTVAGTAIAINEETDIQEEIEAGDLVRVEGLILEDQTLLATQITLVEEQAPGLPFAFTGVVQAVSDEMWTISGVSIAVDDDTELDEDLVVGDIVEVEGWILADSTWLARSIERQEEQEYTFEFIGSVESMAPWIVSGIAFTTDEWTEIEPGIQVGDTVRVEGQILEGGIWLATGIELLGEELLYVEFVGQVETIDPWTVSGVSFAVDDETEIADGIEVGTWVKVRVQILPDDTWLATEIEPIDVTWGGGCMWFSSVVVSTSADQIVLGNSATIPLGDGIIVEGEIEVGSVILILICVDEDNSLAVISIIVIGHLDILPVLPTVVVPPPAPPPEEATVTICHKPGTSAEQTKVIPKSALKGHLGHGDTEGPCK